MNVVSRVAIIACVSLFATSVVQAGDLPVRAPANYAPYYDWSGYYAGVFGGGSHGLWTVDLARNNNHGHTEQGADGLAIGVYGGYNYQLANRFVIGAELDLGHSSASQSNNIYDNDTSYTKYGTFGSARMRIGYAFDRLLVFGTIGVGIADMTNNIQKGRNAGEQFVWEDQIRAGVTTGGGVEYAFSDRGAGRAEYVYTNYGSVTLYNADNNRGDFKNEMHLVRVGVSYRF